MSAWRCRCSRSIYYSMHCAHTYTWLFSPLTDGTSAIQQGSCENHPVNINPFAANQHLISASIPSEPPVKQSFLFSDMHTAYSINSSLFPLCESLGERSAIYKTKKVCVYTITHCRLIILLAVL